MTAHQLLLHGTDTDMDKLPTATNRPNVIDPAIIRPGRIDEHIHIPAPGKEVWNMDTPTSGKNTCKFIDNGQYAGTQNVITRLQQEYSNECQ